MGAGGAVIPSMGPRCIHPTHRAVLDILIDLLTRVRGLSTRGLLPHLDGLLVCLVSNLLRGVLDLGGCAGLSGIVLVGDVGFLRGGGEDVGGLTVSSSVFIAMTQKTQVKLWEPDMEQASCV